MAYFSNGSEGDRYEQKWCERCAHYPEGEDDPWCTVWEAHKLATGTAVEQELLDILIPMSKEGHALQCTMFMLKGSEAVTPPLRDLYSDRTKLAQWVQAVQP